MCYILEAIKNARVSHLTLNLGQRLQTRLQHIDGIHCQRRHRPGSTSCSKRHEKRRVSGTVVLAWTVLVQSGKQWEVDHRERNISHHCRRDSLVQTADALLAEQCQRDLAGRRLGNGFASQFGLGRHSTRILHLDFEQFHRCGNNDLTKSGQATCGHLTGNGQRAAKHNCIN